jgi:hypothetical protein
MNICLIEEIYHNQQKGVCMNKLIVSIVSLLFFANAYAYKVVSTQSEFNKIRLEIDLSQTSKQVDLLFVVDNSGSMLNHQNNLVKNIPNLVNQLSGFDMHAAVITADMDGAYCSAAQSELCGGRFFNGFVTNNDPDYLNKLQNNITGVGVNGSGNESLFDATIAALSPPLSTTDNKGFLRDTAQLVIIFLTDAEDQSSLPVSEFIKSLKALKTDPAMIYIAAIYIPSNATVQTNCSRDSSELPVKFEEALKEFSAFKLNICEDYGPQFQTISSVLGKDAPIFDRSIRLPVAPLSLNSVHVNYGNTELVRGDLDFGWIYNSNLNSIQIGKLFDPRSQPGVTKIYIEYVPK